MLHEHCGSVPPALEHAYADAVAGFGVVLYAAVLWVAFGYAERLFKRCRLQRGPAEDDAGGGDGGGSDASKRAADELAAAEARDKPFFLLVQVLCGCNALGSYFLAPGAAPSGGSWLCRPAHVGLAIFYVPVVFPLWYCLLSLLDISGKALPHTCMTETLSFVVHALFLAWFAVCGALSLPLVLGPYIYIGLAFLALPLLYLVVMDRFYEGDGVEDAIFFEGNFTSTGIIFGRNGLWREEGDELSPALQAKMLATEQLFFRMSGYAVFSSTVFGIGLWGLYEGRSYTAVLGDAGRWLSAGLPVWDPAALLARLELLRWPSELDLFRKYPLAVSLGFLGIEAALKVWRRVDPHLAGTTQSAVADYKLVPSECETDSDAGSAELQVAAPRIAEEV